MWIKDKRDGVYDHEEESPECCERCDDYSEELFTIKCGHVLCLSCISDFAVDLEDDDAETDRVRLFSLHTRPFSNRTAACQVSHQALRETLHTERREASRPSATLRKTQL
jgi:hypothetical protein